MDAVICRSISIPRTEKAQKITLTQPNLLLIKINMQLPIWAVGNKKTNVQATVSTPATLSHAQHHFFIPPASCQGVRGLQSACGGFSLLLFPPDVSLLQHGPSTRFSGYLLCHVASPLTLFSLLFLSLFVPSFSLCLYFMLFLKQVFMEMPSAWLMDSSVFCGGSFEANCTWLSGTEQPLASSHKEHTCSPPGYHLSQSWKTLWNFYHMVNPVPFPVFCFSLVYIPGYPLLCNECKS